MPPFASKRKGATHSRRQTDGGGHVLEAYLLREVGFDPLFEISHTPLVTESDRGWCWSFVMGQGVHGLLRSYSSVSEIKGTGTVRLKMKVRDTALLSTAKSQ